MLNPHPLECTIKDNDHIPDLLLIKYWELISCKYWNWKWNDLYQVYKNVEEIYTNKIVDKFISMRSLLGYIELNKIIYYALI